MQLAAGLAVQNGQAGQRLTGKAGVTENSCETRRIRAVQIGEGHFRNASASVNQR